MNDRTENATTESVKPISVWIDGCFDLVHFGHANAIRQAKSHGQRLVVGIHSDNEIYSCKNSKPIFTEKERYKLVRSIKWVDQVIEDVPYNTKLETLDKHDCDICMHGDDLVFDENGQDLYAPFREKGKFKEFQRTEGVSTTDILERILNAYQKLESSGYTLDTSSNNLIKPFTRSASFTVPKVDYGEECEKKHVSPYTSGGTKYYLNTMRISQFSGHPVKLEPKPSDVVVYCPGTFDLFHIGHVEFLEEASKLGDYLIVGLYGDQLSQMETGKIGTILRLEERMLSVLACKFVNNVIADVPYVIDEKFLDSYKINLVVVGKVSKLDSNELITDPLAAPKNRGILRRIDSGSNVTTTSVIGRIVRNQLEITRRNAMKQKREANLLANCQKLTK